MDLDIYFVSMDQKVDCYPKASCWCVDSRGSLHGNGHDIGHMT